MNKQFDQFHIFRDCLLSIHFNNIPSCQNRAQWHPLVKTVIRRIYTIKTPHIMHLGSRWIGVGSFFLRPSYCLYLFARSRLRPECADRSPFRHCVTKSGRLTSHFIDRTITQLDWLPLFCLLLLLCCNNTGQQNLTFIWHTRKNI